jgi:hypothetical protein
MLEREKPIGNSSRVAAFDRVPPDLADLDPTAVFCGNELYDLGDLCGPLCEISPKQDTTVGRHAIRTFPASQNRNLAGAFIAGANVAQYGPSTFSVPPRRARRKNETRKDQCGEVTGNARSPSAEVLSEASVSTATISSPPHLQT